MKYCPECGVELGKKLEGGRERLACTACSFIDFGQFSIGVGAVVVRDGRVLLIKRQTPGRWWWQIPGGYSEQDEAVDVAIVREVLEETGVQAHPTGVVGLRHSQSPSATNVYIVFRMDAEDGEPRGDGEETTDACFFTLEEMAGMAQISSMSRWAIRAALSPADGFVRIDAPEMARPGFVLYGVREQ